MKNKSSIRRTLIISATAVITSLTIFAQNVPWLGQVPPGIVPKRLVPDSLAANSQWQYHGTPAFSSDGTEMYYAIYRYNPGRVELWYTECVNGQWAVPKKAPFSVDSYTNNCPQFSRHKDTLYFLSSRPGGFIYRVTRNNGVWSAPAALALAIPPGYSPGLQFSIADSRNLYTELSAAGGKEDIYLWRFVNGQYQSPEKLTAVSSPELDFTPYIDPAERFIMFSSRRPGGFGNTDIYISKKNPDNTWSSPLNVGKVINSGEVIQPSFSRDGKYFFFEAWMPSAAGGNPYWVDANVVYKLIEDSTVTDADGNVYKTVKIGKQTWMAENLRSTHYNDGTLIPHYIYNNDTANVRVYGRLYSWAAAMKGAKSSNTNPSNVQGIAPPGWHLPSKAEWEQLINYLGGVNTAGGKMKAAGNEHWISPNTGATNESGFTALPAGMHDFTNIFQWKGDHCAFSTSTWPLAYDYAVIAIMLVNNSEKATIGDFHPDDAYSVRCVKNETGTEVKKEFSKPTGFNLHQNYPNPFNPSTTITYELPAQSFVTLNIINTLGEIVSSAVNRMQNAGVHEYSFHAADLSSGVYFYQLKAINYRNVKRMVLVR